MDKIIEYEHFDINDYIGQPVAQDIHFRNQLGQTFLLTIYDNKHQKAQIRRTAIIERERQVETPDGTTIKARLLVRLI